MDHLVSSVFRLLAAASTSSASATPSSSPRAGMSFPGVTRALARRGFDAAELAEAWRVVQDLTADAFETLAVADDTPDVLAQLDSWENEWFSVAGICLRARYPDVHAWLFERLEQTDGIEVALSVPLFVQRLANLDTVPDGPRQCGPGTWSGAPSPALSSAIGGSSARSASHAARRRRQRGLTTFDRHCANARSRPHQRDPRRACTSAAQSRMRVRCIPRSSSQRTRICSRSPTESARIQSGKHIRARRALSRIGSRDEPELWAETRAIINGAADEP